MIHLRLLPAGFHLTLLHILSVSISYQDGQLGGYLCFTLDFWRLGGTLLFTLYDQNHANYQPKE